MKLDNLMHMARTPQVYLSPRMYSSPADLELMRNPSLTVQTFFPYIVGMQKKPVSAAEPTRAPLLGILLCTPYFQVSDKRDHLFGVLGFSDCLVDTKDQEMDEKGKLLKIDYSLSFSQVYQNITYYFIRKTQSLYILSLINDNQDIELPSWTVDWRTVNTPWGPLPGGLERLYNGEYASVYDYMEPGALGMIRDLRPSKVGSPEWQSRLLGLFLHELARRLYSTTERSLYHNRYTKKQYWHHFGRMMDFDCKTGDVRLVKNTLCVRGTPLATLESGNIEDEPCTPFLYLEGTARGGRPAPGGGGWEGYVQYSDLGRFKRKRLRKAQEWAKQNLKQWYDEPRKDGMVATTVASTVHLRDEIMPLLTFGAATPWLDIRQDEQVHCWMTRVAMVPRHSKEGDQIVLLRGCAYPFLLRPSGDKWKVIGITLYPLFCQAYKRNAFEICDLESMDIWRRVFGERGPKASQQEFQLI
ncbi:hypothetical protein PFICI_11730 [Pestalotiopsis fici W106-1]|uniref:Heterokaryon incompatibility domain-containing protein n=1 Tax=Pestalotiopsis fici (strain W106-1 / CGMCC3.15140) TaxID=1229662 RepID=W3WR75_PESFW|nr:uncharacterized protein PFICI_11730 [Pestalotiopsis fici W106-1]ETS76343.1 hypothetical protein PFICI_11730 [Pestalotiopsis fici W106-1]